MRKLFGPIWLNGKARERVLSGRDARFVRAGLTRRKTMSATCEADVLQLEGVEWLQ